MNELKHQWKENQRGCYTLHKINHNGLKMEQKSESYASYDANLFFSLEKSWKMVTRQKTEKTMRKLEINMQFGCAIIRAGWIVGNPTIRKKYF